MKLIIPIILIVVAVVGVLMFINPLYSDISALKAQQASYDEALQNSKALENARDALTKKYNSISAENLDKLSKFLPNNVDNIRLILEIEKIAGPFNMVLRDVKYNTTDNPNQGAGAGPGVTQDTIMGDGGKEYGSLDLEFSTQGNYDNFINFVKSLENNLRVVDISSVEFSSAVTSDGKIPSNIYKYLFKIRTYWLKD